ncbi:hypothetical protein D9615_007039 [Tricholomella constricta]|uniref:DUS-like FMN-binding domain-containing protein n=1 Tax=Tricholomella constricta TaxID=117010 RepID=A0A8H5H8G1_9AGAR|nr:hypothetical protein D9615_007039 [Tricholomella constricta]
MDEWDLVVNLINTPLCKDHSFPVTATFRIFPKVERAGAQIFTCHGCTTEQRGPRLRYAHIRAVKAAVRVPVFANDDVFVSDNARCLAEPSADAVMSAEIVLYNSALFDGLTSSSSLLFPSSPFQAPTPPAPPIP